MADESIFDLAETNGYKSPFGNWEEEDFKNTNSLTNDTPTVLFKGKEPEEIEINKKTLLNFEISGTYEEYGGDKFDVEIINDKTSLKFSTDKWSDVERGWSLKSYVTSSLVGEFIFQFKVDGKISNSLSLRFKPIVKQGKSVNDPPCTYVTGLNLSAEQKAKFISTIVAETGMGSEFLKDIAWVYFNRVKEYGFDHGFGMKASTAYRKKNRNYKLCMYYLGYGNEYSSFKYDGTPLSKYVKENEWFKTKVEPNIIRMKEFIEKEIFVKRPKNCFVDWIGQGYWRDLELNPDDPNNTYKDPKWYMARQYYWLQLEKKVTKKYVHIMKDGRDTSFIFDEKSIADFFDKNPKMLPDPEKVKDFYTTDGLSFDL